MPSKKSKRIRWMNFWPPFWAAGIRISEMNSELTYFKVELRMRPWNRNYFGTHFGGSLYAMVDPFFALILTEALGREFIVWDKAATIQFRKPGRGVVTAVFELTPDQIAEVRDTALRDGRAAPSYRVEIRDEAGDLVAEAQKTISVRLKNAKKGVSPN